MTPGMLEIMFNFFSSIAITGLIPASYIGSTSLVFKNWLLEMLPILGLCEEDLGVMPRSLDGVNLTA
jgi:hypothetical protein